MWWKLHLTNMFTRFQLWVKSNLWIEFQTFSLFLIFINATECKAVYVCFINNLEIRNAGWVAISQSVELVAVSRYTNSKLLCSMQYTRIFPVFTTMHISKQQYLCGIFYYQLYAQSLLCVVHRTNQLFICYFLRLQTSKGTRFQWKEIVFPILISWRRAVIVS